MNNFETQIKTIVKARSDNWMIFKIISLSLIIIIIIIIVIIIIIKIVKAKKHRKHDYKQVNLIQGFLPKRVNQTSKLRRKSTGSIELDPVTSGLINTIKQESMKKIKNNLN